MKYGFLNEIFYKIFLNKIDRTKLNEEQNSFLELNVKKHVKIFILILITMPYVYFVITRFYLDKIDIVMTALLGVLFVSGTAWYAISFGTVPARFLEFALEITSYLFAGFTVSLAAVLIAGSIAVPFLIPILFIAFFNLYAASVKYDIADSLKIGIDEAMFKHAIVGRRYFTKELKKK